MIEIPALTRGGRLHLGFLEHPLDIQTSPHLGQHRIAFLEKFKEFLVGVQRKSIFLYGISWGKAPNCLHGGRFSRDIPIGIA